MSNLKTILYGNVIFVGAVFAGLLMQWVLPTLLDAVNPVIGNTAEGIIWVGAILVWAMFLIIAPTALMVSGIREEREIEQPMLNIAGAVLYCLISIVLYYFTYSWTTTFTTLITIDILTAMFWIGMILTWIMNVAVIPASIILESYPKL